MLARRWFVGAIVIAVAAVVGLIFAGVVARNEQEQRIRALPASIWISSTDFGWDYACGDPAGAALPEYAHPMISTRNDLRDSVRRGDVRQYGIRCIIEVPALFGVASIRTGWGRAFRFYHSTGMSVEHSGQTWHELTSSD